MALISPPTLVFYLEMCDPRDFRPKPPPPGFSCRPLAAPDPELNRWFYVCVGSEYRWTDRLDWSYARWSEYVRRPQLETWIARMHGQPAGYCELEHQAGGNVQIAYFGVLPDFVGQGVGGAMLSEVVRYAWSLPATRRIWLHTCSRDHGAALPNYRARGFSVYRIEPRP
ncbi:MAG: GNAT family N-acetyltransferase [Planctomycetota bacterium]|nr:MAG: GNAT family N-acetyltransferase [Planctomycetota bacterium]